MRQQLLETRINKLHRHAGSIVTILGNVSARVPGVLPESLDELHKHIKRGELRRVLVACEAISVEVETALPEPDALTQADRVARRAERRGKRTHKRKAKKKATKKKTGG